MLKAPIPENEEERLEALHALRILDTPPEEQFDRITRLAVRVFEVPISTMTLVDKDREWFKSCQGLSQHEGDRAISFCGHALLADDLLLVPDTLKDPRFADNPMVTGEPHIRFYAGAPILDVKGLRLGVLCIKDRKPRDLAPEDVQLLRDLADWASLELRIIQLQQALLSHKHLQEILSSDFDESRNINRMVSSREVAMMKLKEEKQALEVRLKACEDELKRLKK